MKLALLCGTILLVGVVPSIWCLRYDKYGESCKREIDCGGYLACNKDGVCDCFKSKDREFTLFFDVDLGACFSRVDKKCRIIPAKEYETPFQCLPNGHCERSLDPLSRYGYCKCSDGYESADGGKLCRLIVDKAFIKKTTTVATFPVAKKLSNFSNITIVTSAMENETIVETSNMIPAGLISRNASIPVNEEEKYMEITTLSSEIQPGHGITAVRYSFAFIVTTILLFAIIKIAYYVK